MLTFDVFEVKSIVCGTVHIADLNSCACAPNHTMYYFDQKSQMRDRIRVFRRFSESDSGS